MIILYIAGICLVGVVGYYGGWVDGRNNLRREIRKRKANQ